MLIWPICHAEFCFLLTSCLKCVDMNTSFPWNNFISIMVKKKKTVYEFLNFPLLPLSCLLKSYPYLLTCIMVSIQPPPSTLCYTSITNPLFHLTSLLVCTKNPWLKWLHVTFVVLCLCVNINLHIYSLLYTLAHFLLIRRGHWPLWPECMRWQCWVHPTSLHLFLHMQSWFYWRRILLWR